MLFGEPILALFGPGYTAGYTVLVLLALGVLARAATGPVQYLLAMTGHHGASVGILAFAAALALVLNVILIPAYGIEGAAVSTLIAMTVSVAAMAFLAWRKLGIRSFVF